MRGQITIRTAASQLDVYLDGDGTIEATSTSILLAGRTSYVAPAAGRLGP